MISGIVVTLILFLIAIMSCVAINFTVFKYVWEGTPHWIQELTCVVSITTIMLVLYHLVGWVWGG